MAGKALEKYKQRMAEAAEEYVDQGSQGGAFITTRGGILKYGEEELPGNQMMVVVLDSILENTYYEGKFDPDVMLPPLCFAFGRNEKEMEPHENVLDDDDEGAEDSYFELQADECSECPHAQWGSADTGKGKACSNRRRLAVIPAGRFVPTSKRGDYDEEVFEEPDEFKDGDISFLKLPVTSGKAWNKYVRSLSKEHGAPPFCAITHVYLESDAKTSFKVHFELVEVIEDADIIDILFARNSEAKEIIEQPYGEPTEEEMEQPKAKASKGIQGLKKKKRRR